MCTLTPSHTLRCERDEHGALTVHVTMHRKVRKSLSWLEKLVFACQDSSGTLTEADDDEERHMEAGESFVIGFMKNEMVVVNLEDNQEVWTSVKQPAVRLILSPHSLLSPSPHHLQLYRFDCGGGHRSWGMYLWAPS